MRYKFRRHLLYILLRLIIILLYPFPLKVAVLFGRYLGRLAYLLSKRLKLQTIENLTLAFESKTPSEIKKIAKEVFENQGRTIAELINFPKINASNIDRLIETQGWEKVDEALKQGKGAIMLTAHLGNWELLAAYPGIKGYATNAIARKLRYEKYDNLINSIRRSKNINVLTRGNSFKAAVRALGQNQLVGLLPDQDIDSIEGVFVDFFGRKAYTSIGPVALGMLSKAAILPCYIIRQNGKHKIFVESKIELEITQDKQRDYLVNTAKWSKVLQEYITRYPSQWVWMHKRWKTQQRTS